MRRSCPDIRIWTAAIKPLRAATTARFALWGLLVMAPALLFAAGCGESGPDPDSPGGMLKEYYRLLGDDQLEAAYEKLSAGRQQNYYSPDAFSATVYNGEELLCPRVEPFRVDRKQGELAEVDWRGDCGPIDEDTQQMRGFTDMRKQDGEWKVDMNFIAPASQYDY